MGRGRVETDKVVHSLFGLAGCLVVDSESITIRILGSQPLELTRAGARQLRDKLIAALGEDDE